MRVADYIATRVEQLGTDCVFMLTGGMMMHLMDAFGRRPAIRYYCNHHEQACAMAADAYARQTGKLGVCIATSGPGATNLLTGIVGAYQDSSPVLFLTGQCKRKETVRWRGISGLRQCGLFEVDIIPIVQSVTKYAAFVDEPGDIRLHLDRALHAATTGRPGPVLLDMPLDVQGAQVNEEELIGLNEKMPEEGRPVSSRDMAKIIDAVTQAQRPLLLAGHGIRSAGLVEVFRQLVDYWQVPVAVSQLAKDLLHYEHPLFVGHPGPRGDRAANFAIQSADVIVTLGCSLHLQTVGYESDLFAPQALKIQIDVDPAVLKREQSNIQWKYQWDLHDYLPQLKHAVTSLKQPHPGQRWRCACRQWRERFAIIKEPHELGAQDEPINLYEFVDLLSDALTGQETLLSDAGQPYYVLAQGFRLKDGQRYLNPGSFAEMGYALPASIGAAAAAPEKQIVVVIGDGSLQTNIQELQTLVHHQFNVKLFVINNNGYASIRNTQRTFFEGHFVGSTPESGVTMPEISKIACAYGLRHILCESRSVAAQRIRETLAADGPVLCEVMGQVSQRVMPVVPSYMLPDGTMKSKALHEMAPDIGVNFSELVASVEDHPRMDGDAGIVEG